MTTIAITPERASAILNARLQGATKQEIARVFGIRENVVRAVIEATRKTCHRIE
jgi:DNA-directed RNA polymerase specialized sigma24 family protein